MTTTDAVMTTIGAIMVTTDAIMVTIGAIMVTTDAIMMTTDAIMTTIDAIMTTIDAIMTIPAQKRLICERSEAIPDSYAISTLFRRRIQWFSKCFKCSRYLSASIAAMHPVPAAVTACRYVKSCASPQANTPGIFVSVVLFVVIK